MLFWLAERLAHHYPVFHVFQYLTLRAILSTLTAFVISLALGPYVIDRLRLARIREVIRLEGPQSHQSKTGTPTMGGIFILFSILSATLLWGNWSNRYLWVILGVTAGFGLLGFIDDYRKLTVKNTRGLSAKWKYLWQSLIALVCVSYLYFTATSPAETSLLFPFFKHWSINLGIFYILWSYFVIVGSSNAVNFTDGLDGLAILPVVMIGAALGAFAYLVGNIEFSKYLIIPYISGVGELVVFCGALAGAGLGFLWFNAYPAQIIMGDVGALSLGAALGTLAVIVRQELVLFLMGGIFVLETLSVILQVVYARLSGGKRILRMAPLHHHFELKGWDEPKIIVRFWIVTLILVLIGIATLKLR